VSSGALDPSVACVPRVGVSVRAPVAARASRASAQQANRAPGSKAMAVRSQCSRPSGTPNRGTKGSNASSRWRRKMVGPRASPVGRRPVTMRHSKLPSAYRSLHGPMSASPSDHCSGAMAVGVPTS